VTGFRSALPVLEVDYRVKENCDNRFLCVCEFDVPCRGRGGEGGGKDTRDSCNKSTRGWGETRKVGTYEHTVLYIKKSEPTVEKLRPYSADTRYTPINVKLN
jgi:hypothetical protein